VRCPECGKSYIVPEPKKAAAVDEVQFEELAAASVLPPATSRSTPLVTTPVPASPRTQAAIASPATPAVDHSAPIAPTTRSESRALRRSSSDELMYPELEHDSPLPVVEILSPPVFGRTKSTQRSARGTATALSEGENESPLQRSDDGRSQRSTTAEGTPTPTRSAAEEAADFAEVQERIRRHRAKALINLAVFVVGIAVMTAFAFLVVRFSRP
jgi:hypothetical protein